MENILGILGGMGPMATQEFCKLLISHTDAEKDQDHINFILINHATMPDRTSAILSGDTKKITELLLADCRTLENLGAKAICVPCNTSHFILHQIESELKIPLISLIRETAKEMGRKHRGEKVGILATNGTIETGLYQKALEEEGVESYAPTKRSQELVMHLIYDCVKAGKPGDSKAVHDIALELKAAGCREALLACTELPLLTKEGLFDDKIYYADPMEIMAVRAIEFMGKKVINY